MSKIQRKCEKWQLNLTYSALIFRAFRRKYEFMRNFVNFEVFW